MGDSTTQKDSLTVGGNVVITTTNKRGILRFLGETSFKEGIWAGIELPVPEGKNDGTVAGVSYFSCKPLHGVFISASKVTPIGSAVQPLIPTEPPKSMQSSRSSQSPRVGLKRTDPYPTKPTIRSSASPSRNGRATTIEKRKIVSPSSRTPSKSPQTQKTSTILQFSVNEKVKVGGKFDGTVKFAGQTQFSDGIWYGIHLDTPDGLNNGTVKGVSYFETKDKHGLFCRASNLSKVPNRKENISTLLKQRMRLRAMMKMFLFLL